VRPHLSWNVALWLGIENDPLVAYRLEDGERVGSLVQNRLGGSLQGSIALWDRLQLGFELPLVAYQGRDSQIEDTMLEDLSSFGAGGLRIAPKVALPIQVISVAIIPAFRLPSPSSGSYIGEG